MLTLRALVLALAASILVLAAPAVNASGPVCEDDYGGGCWCGPYTWHVGGPEQGVATSEHGSVHVAAAGWYVFVDSPHSVLLTRGLFSIWVTAEGNGMPGAQRTDEVCDDCDGGARCDGDVLLP